jgi:hypothetical protein
VRAVTSFYRPESDDLVRLIQSESGPGQSMRSAFSVRGSLSHKLKRLRRKRRAEQEQSAAAPDEGVDEDGEFAEHSDNDAAAEENDDTSTATDAAASRSPAAPS